MTWFTILAPAAIGFGITIAIDAVVGLSFWQGMAIAFISGFLTQLAFRRA